MNPNRCTPCTERACWDCRAGSCGCTHVMADQLALVDVDRRLVVEQPAQLDLFVL